MTSEEYEDILFNHRILRWSARIVGTLEALFLFYLAYGQVIKGLFHRGFSAFIPLLNGQYFLAISLTIAFIGLIIAYWKEGLGGGITLVSFIVLFFGWNDFHVSFILGMGLASIPSILYCLYWLMVHLEIRKAKRNQTTTL